MAVPCTAFTDFLSRKSEHLDETIIRAMHPIDTWIGHVETGDFPAFDGVEHTFDRFENVFPDLRGAWENVEAGSCVGTPCDPSVTKIGFGFTRDSYRLQRKAYSTDLFCFEQIMTADRAKEQWTHILRTLRRATSIITSHRLRNEALRIAGKKWVLRNNAISPVTMSWDATMTLLTVSALPTSKITAAHLQRRVQPQIRNGALGEELNKGGAPMLEYVTAMDEIWNLVQNNGDLTDAWRFTDFGTDGAKYFKYGWTGKIGNYGLRDDTFQLRFNLKQLNADGSAVLELVLPYNNVSATEGIKEQVNEDWDLAHYKIDFIWHRRAMIAKTRKSSPVNPEMPFAAQDYGGRWKFAMDNLTCGVDVNGNPIAVNNEWRNKGKFLAKFSGGTKAQYPELAEAFLALREPAVIVDVGVSSADPGYPAQEYSSANDPCPSDETVLNFTPIINETTGFYEVPASQILCNGMTIFHAAITGSATLADLVIQLNSVLSAMGTWAVDGTEITLTGTVCQNINIPWKVA